MDFWEILIAGAAIGGLAGYLLETSYQKVRMAAGLPREFDLYSVIQCAACGGMGSLLIQTVIKVLSQH